MGVGYSFPANFTEKHVEELEKMQVKMKSRDFNPHGDYIENIYGSFPRTILGHARTPGSVPKIDLEASKDYIQAIRKLGINFHFTLNSLWSNEREKSPQLQGKLKSLIGELIDIGVNGFIVANPYLIKKIKEWFQDAFIIASINLKIDSEQLVKRYLEFGAGSIVLDREINRNFKLLGSLLSKYPENLVLLANSTCLLGCPLQTYHSLENGFLSLEVDDFSDIEKDYYYSISDQIKDENFCFNYCLGEYAQNPELLLKAPWIRPGDLHYYTDIGLKFLKIQGRTMSVKDQISLLSAYTNRKLPVDNLFFIWPNFENNIKKYINQSRCGAFRNIKSSKLDEVKFLEDIVIKKRDCRLGCGDCCYCDTVFKKIINTTFYVEYLSLNQTLPNI